MFPQLARFTDFALLLLRLMVGPVFITSGYRHLTNPEARSKSIGTSKGFTIFLGIAEVAGSLGLAFGVLTQLAAFGPILLILGAIQKKIFASHTGFWGDKAYGNHAQPAIARSEGEIVIWPKTQTVPAGRRSFRSLPAERTGRAGFCGFSRNRQE